MSRCIPRLRFAFRKNEVMCRHNSTNAANPLPASFLRGGTSKGIFINSEHLPSDKSAWKPIFLGLMGSPDPIYGRQLNGMGGGVSSLSKICVVGRPSAETFDKLDKLGVPKAQIDVEYTFVQVGIKDDSIDISGNCGNLSSMIGAFALDEGMCTVRHEALESTTSADGETIHTTTVSTFNTNTQKVISTTFPVHIPSSSASGPQPVSDKQPTAVLGLPQTSIAGVPGKASQILLNFVNPGGARTGKLLPTGNAVDTLSICLPSSGDPTIASVEVSLVDATNPTVFVTRASVDKAITDLRSSSSFTDYVAGKETPDLTQTFAVSDVLEEIRQQGALAMGLDPSAQAQPKIAILSPPAEMNAIYDSKHAMVTQCTEADIVVHALSMGVLHKAVPMTVGLCLGVASHIKGTIASRIVQETRGLTSRDSSWKENPDLIRILHPSGLVDVGAKFDTDGNVKQAQVVRTGRRLMSGKVWW
ncbi:DUF453-domain-containing protein [Coprinopsis marcescibilis]|uniref:DUF453-domain-containing protein n=1 Tax=Coprinopsis marcescibilis TaxID=230819 RepID=A0A5C3L0H9_COPMA|nr:DUF453-domain-containing protein [Coprinopsis marcescibilis]